MEKTLREELEDAFDIARIEGMLHSKDGKHSLSSEADAEGIIEFISQRIKAKALTDEQIDEQIATGQEVDAYLKKVDDRLKKAVSEKELIATVAGIIRTRKAVKAQHQAVLGELE